VDNSQKLKQQEPLHHELEDEEKDAIREVFSKHVAPKLARLHARNGVISCAFASPQYKNWQIHFRSVGSDFDIVEFEYDEEADGMDLDL
jgi:hypothetical protein